jgi:hypothetical protein
MGGTVLDPVAYRVDAYKSAIEQEQCGRRAGEAGRPRANPGFGGGAPGTRSLEAQSLSFRLAVIGHAGPVNEVPAAGLSPFLWFMRAARVRKIAFADRQLPRGVRVLRLGSLDEVRHRQKCAKAEPEHEDLRRLQCFCLSTDKLVHDACVSIVIDGDLTTPHRQTCRMKRSKFVLISAKKFLLPTWITSMVSPTRDLLVRPPGSSERALDHCVSY